MTKLEELKAARDAAWAAADGAWDAAVKAAWDAYRAELKKTPQESTND
tara:strand:- start:1552 stop:1695 length:144 start_codon:yes stop_codon:yes gene_type:complete